MKPGDILDGRYTIIDRLGAGGMGEVYKATHTILGAPRVIKVVHPHISSNDDARERFLREARASTKVQHPNVATLHDFASTADGAHYMVWEYIDGVNLAQKLRTQGTLPPRQAVRIAIQALHGLEAIHRAGIIHRDISPENLMITADDQVKIIDLGVAKVEDTEAVSQTRTGIFVGKLRYAAPEQLGFLPDDEKIDARADIYALAMVLVELLTGRPPYEAKSPHEYYVLHAREPQQRTVTLPPQLPGSAALESILEKALARDRAQRFASAPEFAEALETLERTLPAGSDLPTMAIPLPAEGAGRTAPDTLHRTTLQTGTSDQETVRTPLPAAAPAAPTVLTPLPDVPQARPRRGLNPVWIVGLVALIVLAAGIAIFWPRSSEPIHVEQPGTSTSTQAAMIPTPASQTTVTVVSTTEPVVTTSAVPSPIVPETPTETAGPTATTSMPASKPAPASTPAKSRPRETEPPPAREPRPVPEPKPAAAVPTYVDGGGDETANERAIELARQELQGTRQFALRAGSMQVDVSRAIREHFPDAEFVPYAPVVIRFDGTMERLGRGRKRRAATATILKNDRVVFRYELPDEVYRVGMTPPEAFSRILSDLVE